MTTPTAPMRCPLCRNAGSNVVDSRPNTDGAFTRRRRECCHCGHRFTTYETMRNPQEIAAALAAAARMADQVRVMLADLEHRFGVAKEQA